MESRKMPLTVEAYKIIKDMIINMHLRPGELIIVQQMVSQLNISRTPIREALIKLTQEGLVQETSSRKFQVSHITQASITELYDVRRALELLALQLAFDKIDKRDIALLEDNLKKLGEYYERKSHDAFFQCDNDFHDFWISKCNNQIVNNFMTQLIDKQQRIRYITVHVQGRMYNTLQEHELILQAVKNRDYDAAVQAITQHIQKTKADIIEYLSNNNDSNRTILIYKRDFMSQQ